MATKEIKIDNNSTKEEVLEFLKLANWEELFDIPENVEFVREGVPERNVSSIMTILGDLEDGYFENDNRFRIIQKDKS